MRLHGGQSLSSLHRQTLLARRWQTFNFDAFTWMEFEPANFQQTAGLVLFYDTANWMYAYVTAQEEERDCPVARILINEGDRFRFGSDLLPLQPGAGVGLAVKVRGSRARFYCSQDQDGLRSECNDLRPLGDALPANHLSDDHVGALRGKTVFSGAMVGICAQDMDAHRSYADFKSFNYKEVPRDQ